MAYNKEGYLPEIQKKILHIMRHQFPYASFVYKDNRRLQIEVHLPSDSNQVHQQIKDYQNSLHSKTADEINRMYANVLEKQNESNKKQMEREHKKREASYFFNQSESNVSEEDCNHWAKMSYWTSEETLALLFGKHPAVINWDKIKNYKDKSPFAKEYSKVRELILRAISANEIKSRKDLVGLSPTTIRPADVLTWAKKKGIQVNCILEKIVLEQNKEATDYEALYQDKCRENEELKSRLKDLEKNPSKKTPSAQTIELETKNKMIGVMARKKYQYRASASKSPATKNIHNDILESGLSLSEDTILRHLREASELLSQDHENYG